MTANSLLIHFAKHHPGAVADRMDEYPAEDIAQLLEQFPPQRACPVAARLASRPLSAVLKIISKNSLGAMLASGHYSDVITLVSHMSHDCQQQVLAEATEQHQNQLSRLFHTSLKTLSGIASPDFIRVDVDNLCREVSKQLISGDENEEQPIFVVNEYGEYQGIVSPLALFQEKNANRRISDVLQHVEALSGITPFAAAISAPQWARFRALPVVDVHSRLLGALAYEQLVSAHNSLNEADFGLGELIGEVATGYIDICANLMELTVGSKTRESK